LRGWWHAAIAACLAMAAPAIARTGDCSAEAIGALSADAPVAILSASTEKLSSGDPYCLVAVRVGTNVNILVGLPQSERWNGDIQAEGKGGYGGVIVPPVRSVARGFVGVASDTGHPAMARNPEETPSDDWRNIAGSFAMTAPGRPNKALQEDFGHRSAHLMALIAKQVAAVFYGRTARHAFWNGCSTEGDRGLRAAAHYPEDYDGILAGDPAIGFAETMAFQIWPQVVMKQRVGGPIMGAKLDLATARAVGSCDPIDGLVDGLITDPRRCRYRAASDRGIVRTSCSASDGACLSPMEARAIDEIWRGPVTADGKVLWRGVEPGAPLGMLAGPKPFPYALLQPRFFVYLDPQWDWRTLTIESFPAFFAKSVAAVNPIMATNNDDLARFFARGGRIILYHGFNDGGILPHQSIDYYEQVARRQKMSLGALQAHARLYLFPGVGHCGGGAAPQPPVDLMSDALVKWVEHGIPPQGLVAVQDDAAARRSRPICAYPALAYYKAGGDPDAAASFECRR